ncbi:uncharacterized protein AB675_10255 [Cyphellophora attinorum]|uniref:Heterokaryon incompatibility domain-containing protein n=1 Tax=Cyphellophora attinorum TaxID=1664694 RepID=A0A0N1H618_9EURO|nr:uncharacterized protein AB675_10255 [Phialophora attinorum]KPI37392.1 hypothetical protein AB675_10255 [Phialophora attinorum]
MSSQLPSLYSSLSKSDHEVRVLTLHAGQASEPLKASLEVTSLNLKPTFSALSYEWGPPSPEDLLPITIDGHSFLITPSLHAFLSRVRRPDIHLTLWADAICINQADINERNHQVSLMGEIYKTATEVFSWLGHAAAGSDEVFDLINSRKWSPDAPLDSDQGKNEFFLALCERNLSASFRLLVERPYWTRVWILQEVVLARTVVLCCGGKSASLEVFRKYGVETPLWMVDGTPLSGSGRLDNPLHLVIEQGPLMQLRIVFSGTTQNGDDVPYREDFERPWPVFSAQGSQHIRFTFSRPPGDQFWHIEALDPKPSLRQSSNSDRVPIPSYGHCSFERGESLLLHISTSNVVNIAREIMAFYFGSYRPRAGPIVRRKYSGSDRSFNSLCLTSMRLSCTNIRDHIFGLLGIVTDPTAAAGGFSSQVSLFKPDYKWTPAEVLLNSLNYFQPHRAMDTAVLAARFLGLYDPKGIDDFIHRQKTASLSERYACSVMLSASPVPNSSRTALFGLQHFATSPSAERRTFKLDHSTYLTAELDDAARPGMFRCISMSYRGPFIKPLTGAHASLLNRLAEYFPAITINANDSPQHWPSKNDVVVQMPFMCFYTLLTDEICRENAFKHNLAIDHRADLSTNGAPMWL